MKLLNLPTEQYRDYHNLFGYVPCQRGQWGISKAQYYNNLTAFTAGTLTKLELEELTRREYGASCVGGDEYRYPNSQEQRDKKIRTRDSIRLRPTKNLHLWMDGKDKKYRKLTIDFAENEEKVSCPCCNRQKCWRRLAIYEEGKETSKLLEKDYGICDHKNSCEHKNIPSGRLRRHIVGEHHKWTKLGDNKLKDKVLHIPEFNWVRPKNSEGQRELKRLGYNRQIQKDLWLHFQDEKQNANNHMDSGELNKQELSNLLNSYKTISNRFGKKEWDNPNIGVILSKKRAKDYLISKGHTDFDINNYLPNNYNYNSIVLRHNDTGFVFPKSVDNAFIKYMKQAGFCFNTEMVGVKRDYEYDEEVLVVEGYYDQAVLQNKGMNVVAIGTKHFTEAQWENLADAGVTKVIINLDSEYNDVGEHKHTANIIAMIRFLEQYGINISVLELDRKDLMDYWDKNNPDSSLDTIKRKLNNKIPSYEWEKKVDWDNPKYKYAGHWYLPK